MHFRKILTLFIIVLLLVTISGCTQPNEEAPVKEPQVKYSEPSPENTETIPADTPAIDNPETAQTDLKPVNQATPDPVVNTPKETTFEEDVCDAAQNTSVCDTKLKELGIISKDDCCRLYSRCC